MKVTRWTNSTSSGIGPCIAPLQSKPASRRSIALQGEVEASQVVPVCWVSVNCSAYRLSVASSTWNSSSVRGSTKLSRFDPTRSHRTSCCRETSRRQKSAGSRSPCDDLCFCILPRDTPIAMQQGWRRSGSPVPKKGPLIQSSPGDWASKSVRPPFLTGTD
jgi:hypothetical protein